MSRDTDTSVRKIRWVTFSLIIIALHYWLYLWPLIIEYPKTWVTEDPDTLLIMRTRLTLFTLMVIVAIVFVVRRIKYWHVITTVVCGLGIYVASVPEFFQILFDGVNSLNSFVSRLAIFAKYPHSLLMFRNDLFVPLLYLAVIILVFQDWRQKKESRSDI